jgi:small subunit ribosomal protein S6
MALYESTFIARPEISGQQAEALAERFAGIITENGGKVEKTEYWGLKSLAYRIKKHRKGHYIMFNLDAPSAAVKEMERNMSLDEDVLRILTIRVKELEEGPSAMMQAKSSRGERGDRGDRGDRGERTHTPREREAPVRAAPVTEAASTEKPSEEGAASTETGTATDDAATGDKA